MISDHANEPQLAFCCSPYHRGGVERFMADLAIAWADTVGSSWFVLPTPRRPFRNAGTSCTVASIIENEGRDHPRLHLIQPRVGPEFEFGTESYRAAVYARGISDGVSEGVPVMTSDDPAAWKAAAWMAPRNPCLLVVHGDYDGYYDAVRRYANAATAIVAISGRIRYQILERRLSTKAPVEHLPTGVALGVPRAASTDTPPARLIWIGRMDESSKRISDIPRIASILKQRGIQFHLTLVGDGPSRRILERQIDETDLRGDSRFHGWTSSTVVRGLLEQSDVLLLPSNREGLPVAMMEALAAGCAVVASRVSGVEDYESLPLSSNCLWVHAIGNVEEAANHVEAALTVHATERSHRARALAEAEFAIDRCAERYRDLIRHLESRPTRRSGFDPLRHRLIRWTSAPVSAQRRIRVWASDR